MPPEDAIYYVGGESILARMERAGWLTAVVNQKRLKRYDVRDLDHACDRLRSEELPGMLPASSRGGESGKLQKIATK